MHLLITVAFVIISLCPAVFAGSVLPKESLNSVRNRRAVIERGMDDIQFDIPDIVVEFTYPTKTVTLEAFKVRNRTSSERPKWVSVGYPTIVNNSDGNFFHFTAEYVSVLIRTLDPLQKEALLRQAKLQYPSVDIRAENIVPLPLTQFACGISFYVDETAYELRGSVYDLRTNPLMLRFPLNKRSQKRAAFEKRLQSEDPLFIECELMATGKQERTNTLKISVEQMQELDLAAKVLGPADEKYVVRNQLTRLAQEIKSRLRIEENYEIEGEEFSEEFIQKILDASASRFEPVPIDQALSQLSKYGASFDQRDLSPSEIKRELSDILCIKTEGSKQHIIASRSDSKRSTSNLDTSTDIKTRSSVLGIIDVSNEINFAMKKSNEWARNSSSLDDQLRELNQHSTSGIKWQQEGSRIVPKTLEVAKVTRMTLNQQQLSFNRIKTRVSHAKYSSTYEVSTVITGTFDQQRPQSMGTINDPVQELNRSLTSLSNRLSDAMTTTCVTKFTTAAQSTQEFNGYNITGSRGLGFESLDCGGSEWYLNDIFWQFENLAVGHIHLRAKYRCCKRGK